MTPTLAARLLSGLMILAWLAGCNPTIHEEPIPEDGFAPMIHGAMYHCQVRETAMWNTDMIICWPQDAFTGRSQGVMRFWRENPNGIVGMPPCEES